ncbi:tryptophan halogenase family protein [Colwellia psychrerythraea]|uniref:Tryptophan halogenase n=1 Tax=Colwellia psychrerythraea TaxID=28229 RepID=A0A099KKF9_COLPS|nr:tryptophan halogenase family protein [Colwellia psychrerythraea]KGJ90437.1 tryptophan halogenase [Colwellia psychrerythraea]
MSVINSQPKKIIILGGGSAGWMTASLLDKAWADKGTEILLIESDLINKIGVGEGSTPSLRLFFNHLGISEQEWMPECNATYKCGISFPGWTNRDDPAYADFPAYIHPFYSKADWKTGNAFMHNARLRRDGIDVPAHPDDYWLQSYLAKHFKGPIASQKLRDEMDYGYHFDSALVGDFLKKRLLNKGLSHLVDTVNDVILNDKGEISSVVTKDNGAHTADIFIDCTGFAARLIRGALKVDFIDYSDCLFNDRAIAIQSPIDCTQDIPSQTTSTALSSGWAWRIPLINRYGNGYVYSSKYLSDGEAEKELRDHIGPSCKNQDARVIKMRLGRLSQHWYKNVLAVGLSQGFIEPLEATALMLIQHTVESFIGDYQDMFAKKRDLCVQQDIYNSQLNKVFESIKDYIVAHYRLNSRTDSQYWRDNRENKNNSARLNALLSAWHTQGADFEAELHNHNAELTYFAPSWYCLFAGKGHFPASLNKPSANTKVAPTAEIIKYCQHVSQQFYNHNEQLEKVYGNRWPK